MERLSQEYMLRISFTDSIEREQLLLKKYDEFYNLFKDNELKEMVKEFKEVSREHVELLKDKMMKMNFQS